MLPVYVVESCAFVGPVYSSFLQEVTSNCVVAVPSTVRAKRARAVLLPTYACCVVYALPTSKVAEVVMEGV